MGQEHRSSFRVLLQEARKAIPGKSQERLAQESGVSWRTISDLETGRAMKPHEYTVRRLADALKLTGPRRDAFFEAAGHGGNSAPRPGAMAAVDRAGKPAALARDDPQDWLTFVVRTLDRRGAGAARSAVAAWQAQARVEPEWLAWAERLITLTVEGRLHPTARRPAPAAAEGPLLGRQQEIAQLAGFARRVQGGRGGLLLVAGPAGIGKSRLIIEELGELPADVRVESLTLDRSEAGYRGWSRLLAPLWIMLRRTELAPANLLVHAAILDDILLASDEAEMTRRRYAGEVADAIAALLIHLAAAEAVVVVIDDAHRGGGSSDHLLIEVALRVNAHRVGIIAAVRPDELEQRSPLLRYSHESGGRTGADVVVPIHVPPLGREAARHLIKRNTGAEPPAGLIDEVLRRTGGCPQFINSIVIQHPTTEAPAAAWSAGKFDADGWRALESTITSRSEVERTVLEAAAVSAIGGFADPDTVAVIAGVAPGISEAVLDQERQHGPILMPHTRGYCFQHDSWIDALLDLSPPERLRALHARYLTLLRADRAPDSRRLARHAIGAGAGLVGEPELVTLVTGGADVAVTDYAFGIAAEWYEIAARHANGEQRIDVLIRQSDALRFSGRWAEARMVLKQAAQQARALNLPGREAAALVHLERLTWSSGLDERDVTLRIRDVLSRLPPGATVVRAQVQAALAKRLSITPRTYQDEQADLARAALRQLPSVTEPLTRADIIVGVRDGLQDHEPPERLLELDRELLSLAISLHSAYHMEEALGRRIIDLIRCGRLRELPAAVREHRDFAKKSTGQPVSYLQELVAAMLALARGNFDEASQHTDEAISLSTHWGGSMAGEALMAQTGWRLYEMGHLDGLTEILSGLNQQDVSSLNGPVWALASGLIHAERSEAGEAIRNLRDVCADTHDLRSLPRGPGRIGILAAAAMVLSHSAVCDVLAGAEASRIGDSLCGLLAAHGDELVIAGWPAVLLGSKHRFIGLAHLAAARPGEAAEHLARAAEVNSEFAVLYTRTKFDLARALIRQPASHSAGIAQMQQLREKAAGIKMASLAAQASEQLENERRMR